MGPNSVHLIEEHFGLVHDCMRACVYGDYIQRVAPKDGAWASIMDMCYADAIISWTNIFGNDSEDIHWKKLVEQFHLPDDEKLKIFSSDLVVGYLNISHEDWLAFWRNVVDVRNTRIAHLNSKEEIGTFPNTTWLFHSVYLYREWLLELLKFGQRLGYDIRITEQSSQSVIDLFEQQIGEAVKCP